MSQTVAIVVAHYAELFTIAGLVAGVIALTGVDSGPASSGVAVGLLAIGASSYVRPPRRR
jgi:hypothetical protein